jgi:hypothetical protein
MAFSGEHITTQFQAAPYVLSWLTDRFNGKTASSTYITLNKKPVSTANPVNGDFLFSLKNWTLNGTIHLATLMQDVTLPAKSTMSAETNMTKNTITGTLSIPDFASTINVLLPLSVAMTIESAAPMTGTASLDNSGNLHINGHMLVNLYINSIDILVPLSLKTKTPIDFPIVFDGPVSSLGDGSLKFTGTTTFPARNSHSP